MELDYDAIDRRIREARKEMSLSQEALGEMVGLSTSHICHMEGGNTKPSLNSLVLVANALHVTMDRLLSDNTDIPYDPPARINSCPCCRTARSRRRSAFCRR